MTTRRPVRGGLPALGADGFTLLELIIVMVLMALVVSFTAAFFANSSESGTFNSTVRDVAASIRQAHSLAQFRGEPQTLSFNLDNRTFGIEGRPERQLPSSVAVKIVDPVAGEIATGTYSLVFPAHGAARGGTIVLSNRSKTARISLDPVVGSATVRGDGAS